MKKWMIGCFVFVMMVVSVYLVGTGFLERNDVMVSDFSVSQDGTKMTLSVTVSSSMGFIRDYKDIGGGVKPHMLRFYSTFGGLNSSFGAKRTFLLPIAENDSEIYFCRPGKGYELVLEKSLETREWQKPDAVLVPKEDAVSKPMSKDLLYRGEKWEFHDLVYRGETITVLQIDKRKDS